jgi:hypothetical protein
MAAPSLKEAVACLKIGNIKEPGPVTAIGVGGHARGKVDPNFYQSDRDV